MPKVLITRDKLDLISDISNVGVYWETSDDERRKGFIIRLKDGDYAGLNRRCDLGSVWTRAYKRDYAEAVLDQHSKNKIYLFSTPKELLNWFNNDNSV